jgi:hypothetical protein
MAFKLIQNSTLAPSINISAKNQYSSFNGTNIYNANKGSFYISTLQDTITNNTGIILQWSQNPDNLAGDFFPSTVFLKAVVNSYFNAAQSWKTTALYEITLSANYNSTQLNTLSFDVDSIYNQESGNPYSPPLSIDWGNCLIWNPQNKTFNLQLDKPSGVFNQIIKGIFYFI